MSALQTISPHVEQVHLVFIGVPLLVFLFIGLASVMKSTLHFASPQLVHTILTSGDPAAPLSGRTYRVRMPSCVWVEAVTVGTGLTRMGAVLTYCV